MISSLRVLVLALLLLMPLSAGAQTPSPLPGSSGEQVLKPQQLDALVAPIALYPDTLLTQVLMASTYPLEVVQAERWALQHKKLEGEPLKKEVEKQGWDDSVKSLVATPSVLTMMSKKLDWTQKLGDAVLAQQADVMDAIQRLRSKAYATEKLRPSKEQNVTVRQEGDKQVVAIEPTNAGTLYVPYYDPAVVYGEWPYPDYPPYYYYPEEGYLPGGIIATGIAFGAGYALWRWTTGGRFWGGNINWGGGQIDINRGAHVEHWQHNSKHRRGVAYNNPNVRQKFAGKTNRPANKGQLDLRGRDGQQVLKPGDRTRHAERRPANRPKASDRARDKQVGQAKRPSQASRPSHRRVARNAPSHRVAHRQPRRAPTRVARSHRQSFGYAARRGGHRMAARGGGFRGGGGRGGGRGGRRSDVALKHDIVLLSRLDNGLGFYRFAYTGSNQAYVGVLAQEVQTVIPEAVVRGRDGYLRVYYDKLGLRFQTYRQWVASGAQVPRQENLTSSERSRSK
jgi:Protein of unknown function (DUF3300)